MGWSGVSIVGGGVSTFYTTGDGASLNDDLRAFFGVLAQDMPNLKGAWSFEGAGAIIDSATGDLKGSWSGGSTVSVNFVSSSAVWAAGVGCRMVWDTAGFLRGRRVRGSTFIVPLHLAVYDTDGTINPSELTSMQNAANNLITSHPELTIWSRPTEPGGTDGGATTVTGARLPDRVSWLRSRRT